jgi:hypothetical protein
LTDDSGEGKSRVSRALRLDLLIAVCALLISSLASAASWWQARLLGEQTRVLQEQLGAAVWPYVDANEAIDKATVTFALENNGLGPAILRSETVTVDGARKASMVEVLHAVLGSHLTERKPRGQNMHLTLDADSPGSVLRSGATTTIMSLTSERFAAPLVVASKRIGFQVCYCAIVPGQCWFADSSSKADPKPVPACPEISDDLLHASPLEELSGKF